MTLKITFELEEQDLKYFRSQMNRARKAAKAATEEEVIAKAKEALVSVRSLKKVPSFVAERLDKVDSLISMLSDSEWALEAKERKDVVTALSYFNEPEDMIPDNIPVIGLIDDAIMIELVVRELAPEIEAYGDFCNYRKAAPKASHEDWLEAKRRALFARMRRRRQNGAASRRGPRFRLF